MNIQHWVKAFHDYNNALEKKNKETGLTTVRKNPLALVEKLGEIEKNILRRLLRGNFTCMYPFPRSQTIREHSLFSFT